MAMAASVVLCGLVSVSCNSDSDEMHSVYIIYPSVGSNYYSRGFQPVFADQTEDTLAFCSTEAWELVSSDDSWLHVPEGIKTFTQVKSNSIYQVADLVTFELNKTGRRRMGIIYINAGEYSLQTGYLQLPYLNIHRPMRLMTGTDLITSTNDSLVTITDSCNVTRDSISFTAYKDWTLSAKNGQWLNIETTAGQKGYNKVYVSLSKNDTSGDRVDTILLNSGGIVDAIPFKQYAKPVE